MSLVDAFAKEDRTEVKFSEFFALVKQAAQYGSNRTHKRRYACVFS